MGSRTVYQGLNKCSRREHSIKIRGHPFEIRDSKIFIWLILRPYILKNSRSRCRSSLKYFSKGFPFRISTKYRKSVWVQVGLQWLCLPVKYRPSKKSLLGIPMEVKKTCKLQLPGMHCGLFQITNMLFKLILTFLFSLSLSFSVLDLKNRYVCRPVLVVNVCLCRKRGWVGGRTGG